MATLSFTALFDIVNQNVTFTDTSGLAGQGIPLADVNGSFKITAPSGTVIYNNVDYTNSGCDIHLVASLISQTTPTLPITSSGLIEPGMYTIVYTVYNSNLDVYYTVTQTFTFSYISPVVCIEQEVDCLSPLFTSTDTTDYTVDSIVPTKVEVHTINYPYGSAGQGSPTVGSGLVVTSSTFYNGTQTTTISSTLTYVYPGGLTISDVVTGSKEVVVDCTDVCAIYCCIRTVEQLMENFKLSNRIKYLEYKDKFDTMMAYSSMVALAIKCGKSSEVNGLLAQIRLIGNCTEDCACSDGTPTQVTGLGGLINNIVVDSCGNGITVTPVTVGNTITYTVCLSTAFVNLVNSFYNTIVEAGNNITVVDSGIIGTTRTFTVNGQKTIIESLDSSVTITEKYQTSGVLVVGTKYTIVNYVATDNFTNVGGTNVTGNTFVATGTTPTSWANGSSLQITGTTTYDLSVNSTPGTNAFKYVKVFTTVEIEQSLTITYDELTTCGIPPIGCIADPGDTQPFVNFHVQVWNQPASAGFHNNWVMLCPKGYAPVAGDYDLIVNYSTGTIVINTANNSGNYYVVILG